MRFAGATGSSKEQSSVRFDRAAPRFDGRVRHTELLGDEGCTPALAVQLVALDFLRPSVVFHDGKAPISNTARLVRVKNAVMQRGRATKQENFANTAKRASEFRE